MTALIALFVALGGTSFAAITLPRNSVGHRQIRHDAVGNTQLRRGAVSSRSIKNHAIQRRDLSPAAIANLSGKPGPVGPPGAPAIALRASINAAGLPTAGNAVSSTGAGPNKRLIGFGRELTGCVPTATLARNDGAIPVDPGPGQIVVGIEANGVSVETYDATGAPDFLPFNVIVAC
jgi:hypothetical protein